MKNYEENKEDYGKLYHSLEEVVRLTRKLYGCLDFGQLVALIQNISLKD